MPVILNSSVSRNNRVADTGIHIGLVNNMPDGALQATERQFITLLDSAAGDLTIRLSFYSLPGLPRGQAGRDHIAQFYSSTESLPERHLDGLIVTGAEPRAANLEDEPFWGSLARLLEWADRNTFSTIWSCLAAHAAVLHMDGIRRQRRSEKQCGVFECQQISSHRLMDGLPSSLRIPHSRWNDLPENELTACGYRVLSRSTEVGVDTFIRQQRSLFVFFQGHPEYSGDTLALEYCRDVGRYLKGDGDLYPHLPQGYFGRETVTALNTLQERCKSLKNEEIFPEITMAAHAQSIPNPWRPLATSIYHNWLEFITEQRAATRMSTDHLVGSQFQ